MSDSARPLHRFAAIAAPAGVDDIEVRDPIRFLNAGDASAFIQHLIDLGVLVTSGSNPVYLLFDDNSQVQLDDGTVLEFNAA